MSQIKKLIKKFSSHPSSLKYPEIAKILLHFGFLKIPAKGSHVKFKHENCNIDIIIPVHNGDCKDFYKADIAKTVKTFSKQP